MGKAGIEIGIEGPAESYDESGIGAEAEAAIEELHAKLEQLGFKVTFSAVLTPAHDEEPAFASESGAAATNVPAAAPPPVQQLPVEDGEYKCDQCGLTYSQPGVCVGGEYGHAPNALRPAADVHADAEAAPEVNTTPPPTPAAPSETTPTTPAAPPAEPTQSTSTEPPPPPANW